LPAFETIAPVLDASKGDYGLNSDIIEHRKHAGPELTRPVTALFGDATGTPLNYSDTSEINFRRMIFFTQLAQTLCIKTYLEELRRGEQTFGSIIWQLNDVWQASSWGSLDYGGRWRALHHSLQAIFAPSLVSVWIDDQSVGGTTGGGMQTVNIYGSHHGTVGDSGMVKVEVNVTNIATGAVSSSQVVPWTQSGSATVDPLLKLQMSAINTKNEIVMTRLIGSAMDGGDAISETVHPLLPPASMEWVPVTKDAMVLSVESVAVDGSSAMVTVTNTHGTAPLFYVLVTSKLEGRFSRNLLYLPPTASQSIDFIFSAEGASKDAVLESLSVEWLNKKL
jgi:beta-mannosidase